VGSGAWKWLECWPGLGECRWTLSCFDTEVAFEMGPDQWGGECEGVHVLEIEIKDRSAPLRQLRSLPELIPSHKRLPACRKQSNTPHGQGGTFPVTYTPVKW
jgi:hypothetical protein